MRERDALYRAFAHHRWKPMEACSHCVSPDENARLNAPLEELDAEELGPYAFKAMTTWGDEADYRHYLPRILELTCEQQAPWPGFDLALIARKLIDAGWRDWPTDERAAVEDYLAAWWGRSVAVAEGPELLDYLDAFATLGVDAGPRLVEWREVGDVERLVGCAEYVIDSIDLPAVRAFARDPETVAAFERAFLGYVGAEDVEPLARAADLGRS